MHENDTSSEEDDEDTSFLLSHKWNGREDPFHGKKLLSSLSNLQHGAHIIYILKHEEDDDGGKKVATWTESNETKNRKR